MGSAEEYLAKHGGGTSSYKRSLSRRGYKVKDINRSGSSKKSKNTGFYSTIEQYNRMKAEGRIPPGTGFVQQEKGGQIRWYNPESGAHTAWQSGDKGISEGERYLSSYIKDSVQGGKNYSSEEVTYLANKSTQMGRKLTEEEAAQIVSGMRRQPQQQQQEGQTPSWKKKEEKLIQEVSPMRTAQPMTMYSAERVSPSMSPYYSITPYAPSIFSGTMIHSEQEATYYFEKEKYPGRAKYTQPVERKISDFIDVSKETGIRQHIGVMTTVPAGFVLGGFRMIKQFIYPAEMAKGLVYTVRNPRLVGAQVGQYIQTQDPGVLIGEMAAYYVGGKAIGKAIKKSPIKPEFTKIQTPDEVVHYRGLSLKLGKKGYPLVGRAQGKFKVGTPALKIKGTSLKGGYGVETGAQTRIMQKSLKKTYPKQEIHKFQKGLDIMRNTEKTSSKYVRKEFLKQTKTLSPEQVKKVLKWSKKQKGDVYGSFAARQQMPDELGRMPADIDVQLKTGQVATESASKQLVVELNKVKGARVRANPQRPSLIEVKGAKKWHHAVDIHSIDDAMSSSSLTGDQAFGLKMNQRRIKIEGVRTQRLSEQGIRKGASSFTMREKGFAPEAHRMKDVGDFFTTQKALAKSKMIGGKKVLKNIAELEKMYPTSVTKGSSAVKVQISGSTKIAGSISKYPSFGKVSPSRPSPSPSPSGSPSPSILPRYSPKTYFTKDIQPVSPRVSKRRSPSRSVARSPSYSPPYSPPSKPSPSRSPSPSPSPSPSGSPSPSPSPSPGSSYYYGYTGKTPPPYVPVTMLPSSLLFPSKKKKKPRKGLKAKYTPTIAGIFSGEFIKKIPIVKTFTGIEKRLPILRR